MELFDLVKAAQKRIMGHAHVTPVMTSQTLNDLTGAQIFLKCENYQRMGAFKFRGGYNAMSRLDEGGRLVVLGTRVAKGDNNGHGKDQKRDGKDNIHQSHDNLIDNTAIVSGDRAQRYTD